MGTPTTDSLRDDAIQAVWAMVKDQHQELAKKALVHLQAHSPSVADSIEALFDENLENASKRVIDLVDEAVVTGQWDREKQVGVTQPLPILALTAHALPEYKTLAKDAGLTGFLIKPFLFDNLREKVLEISADIPPH